MKISKRVINVAVFTAVALMFVMVFGYTFRMFSEIKAMDLSGLDPDKMGIAATDMTEDSSKAEPGEADAVAKVETVMLNSMDARDMTASIKADYDNNRMVLLILSDGTEAAAKADDPERPRLQRCVYLLPVDAGQFRRRVLLGNRPTGEGGYS